MINIAIKIKKRYQGRQRSHYNDFVNERIRSKELLVIGPDGQKLGVLSKEIALKKASEYDLDLVLISDKGTVAVAKIIDYGKFKYERKKRESENKKNQKIVETKEIRLRPNIEKHDLETKQKKAREFLKKGNRVKVSLSFRGREMSNKDVGLTTINNFLDSLKDIAQVDKEPKLNGRFLDANISPKKK